MAGNWTKEEREQMKERVKSALIRKPRIGQYKLAKILGINKKTALKLKKEIIRENTRWLSAQKVNEEIGKIEAEDDQFAFECWQIIKDPNTTNKDKISAIRSRIEASKTLFNIKFNSGVFKRKLGELEIEKELTQEEQDLIKKVIELDYGKPKPKPEPETKPEPGPDSTAGEEQDPEGTAVTEGEDKPE